MSFKTTRGGIVDTKETKDLDCNLNLTFLGM